MYILTLLVLFHCVGEGWRVYHRLGRWGGGSRFPSNGRTTLRHAVSVTSFHPLGIYRCNCVDQVTIQLYLPVTGTSVTTVTGFCTNKLDIYLQYRKYSYMWSIHIIKVYVCLYECGNIIISIHRSQCI